MKNSLHQIIYVKSREYRKAIFAKINMDSREGIVADVDIAALKRDLKQPYEEACQKAYDALSSQNKLQIIPFNQYSEIVRRGT